MSNLNAVIIGTGMYVCGRGTSGFGTILPALAEWARPGGRLGEVHCVGTSMEGAQVLRDKAADLEKVNGVHLEIAAYPEAGLVDPLAYRQVLQDIPRPACAIVVVPDHLHHQVVRDCLLAGLHTLVVKPLAPTVAEGRELVALAREQGLYGAVEFHKRWDRANLMLRDRIQCGDLGAPLYCWVEYSQRKSIPTEAFRKWAAKSSILQYLGVHYIDVVRFVTAAVPRKVMAIGQKTWLPTQGIDAHDAIQCVVEWEMPDGHRFTQTLLTNWIDPESSSSMSDQKIKFVGHKGRFESDQKERGIRINRDGAGVEHVNPDFCLPYGTRDGHSVWRGYGIESVCAFLDDVQALLAGKASVRELEESRPTFAEALISTAVLEAAHTSLNQGSSWQDVETTWE